jgi:hydroxyethylthiazole kinase-like uncharacterized protein yjeF
VVSAQAADVAALLPSPTADSDKYRRGVLGLISGSERYTGAAVLSSGGAIHGGAGMIRFISAQPAVDVVRQWWPETVITALPPEPAEGANRWQHTTARDFLGSVGRVQAWTAGPGMGTDDDSVELLAAVLATDLPVLVDADGLTILAEHRELLNRSAPTLITPHAGELSRLTGADRADIEAQRLAHAREAARSLGVTVLLKGSTTVICSPPGSPWARPDRVNSTGTPWLATAGSGDVLSGLAGSLLAQGLNPPDAAAAAAFLHGVAARRAAAGPGEAGDPGEADEQATALEGAPIGAADVVRALPGAIRAVRSL